MAVMFCTVAFNDPPLLEAEAVERRLAEFWPDLPECAEPDMKDGALSFRVGEAFVVIGVMSAPIPWTDLEGPCAASVLWPGAGSVLRAHKERAVVTVMAEVNPVELSKLLTQVAAAVMAASPEALGVYWGNAALLAPKDLFIDFAREFLPDRLPLHIWIDVRVGKDGDATCAGFTRGLAAFEHMEFETRNAPEPPGELRNRLMSLARHVLESGPVISGRDAVGESREERIRIVYADSTFGREGKVMRLEYERAERHKPWWRLWR
jgi:hypothetical protein